MGRAIKCALPLELRRAKAGQNALVVQTARDKKGTRALSSDNYGKVFFISI